MSQEKTAKTNKQGSQRRRTEAHPSVAHPSPSRSSRAIVIAARLSHPRASQQCPHDNRSILQATGLSMWRQCAWTAVRSPPRGALSRLSLPLSLLSLLLISSLQHRRTPLDTHHKSSTAQRGMRPLLWMQSGGEKGRGGAQERLLRRGKETATFAQQRLRPLFACVRSSPGRKAACCCLRSAAHFAAAQGTRTVQAFVLARLAIRLHSATRSPLCPAYRRVQARVQALALFL